MCGSKELQVFMSIGREPQQTREGARDGMVSWCCGLPKAGTRALAPEELAVVRKLGWRMLAKALFVLMGLCGFLAYVIWLAAVLDRRWILGPLVMMIAGSATLLSVPWLLIENASPLRRSLKLLRDARIGVVNVFQGAISTPDQFDEIQKTLMKDGRLIVSPEHMQTVEAFPLSRRIWKVNDRWIPAWMQAEWTEVAEQPAFAAIAAQWLVPSANAPDINIGRRDLSPIEQTELRDRARSVWRRPLPLAIALNLWLFWPLEGFVFLGRVPHISDWSGGVLTHLWAVVVDVSLFFSIRRARELRKDLTAGVLHIVEYDRDSGAPVPTVAGGAAAPDHPKSIVEYLPSSRRPWTENGTPASWRRHRA